MGSRRPISAILAVFGGLEIGLRCARDAGWVCIRCIYDLRRPPGYSLSPQKSVKRLFRGQIAGRSWFSVRHDAGVFRPNGRHQRNANGEKTLKPGSFGFCPLSSKDTGFRVFSPFWFRWCRRFGLKTPASCRTRNCDLPTFWPRKSVITDF